MGPIIQPKMAAVSNQAEFISLMKEIGQTDTSLSEDLKSPNLYLIHDPKELANVLANATSFMDVQDCLNLDNDAAQKVCDALHKNVLDEVFKENDVAKKVASEKEQFYNLQSIELPVYDENEDQLPLTSYKLKC